MQNQTSPLDQPPSVIASGSATAGGTATLISGNSNISHDIAASVACLSQVFSGITNGEVIIAAGRILASPIVANEPGTSGTPETWHTVTSLQNSWTAVACRYKLLPFNAVWLQFSCSHAGTNANAQIYTLPTGYIPSVAQVKTVDFIEATNWVLNPSSAENPQIRFDTSGDISIDNLPTATTNIQFNCIISLD
jgi:hypothetical protein